MTVREIHKNWLSVMLAVEYIESLDDNSYDIEICAVTEVFDNGRNIKLKGFSHGLCKLDSTYNTVICFLNQYNNNIPFEYHL